MVNIPNILIVTFLLADLISKISSSIMFLLDRFCCLLYTIFHDKNADINSDSIQLFIYFEMPFYFVNVASLVLYFEW